MADEDVQDRIERLVGEEHALLERGVGGGLSEEERARLQEVQVELDRYWDLLRQRRAERAAGRDPDDASLRGPDTVEGYEQ